MNKSTKKPKGIKEILNSTPSLPGVYLMKGNGEKVIYVGKAKNLKKRISSYFSKTSHDSKTLNLVSAIKNLEFIVTENETEALILESNLIKKLQPKFNIELKDSIKYPFIKITLNEKFPQLIVARTIANDKSKYFGPFTDGNARNIALHTLRGLFGIRTCNHLPKKPCLNYFINRCSAPCIKEISSEKYNLNITKILEVLSGNSNKLIKKLTIEMSNASKNHEFEQAKSLRDQINAINKINEKQHMFVPKTFDQDAFGITEFNDQFAVQVFRVRKGVVLGRKHFLFSKKNKINSSKDALFSAIQQMYEKTSPPLEILLPESICDNAKISDFLKHNFSNPVKILEPVFGNRKELVKLAQKNASIMLCENPSLVEIKEALLLSKIPFIIDCFDISTIQGTDSVGSAVRFVNGNPEKSEYRRFKIKNTVGINDFAMIEETISRRYELLKRQGSILPDLIVVDGGKGQLTSALNAVSELNLKIPIVSIAKKHEELFVPSRKTPILLDKKSNGLKLIQRLRDESHRFAITYHKKIRSNRLHESELDSIKGVGEKTKLKLLKEFGSTTNIKNTNLETLSKCIGLALAEKIKKHFKK